MRTHLLALASTMLLRSISFAQPSNSKSTPYSEEAPSWIWLLPTPISTPEAIVTITIFVTPSASISANETTSASEFSISTTTLPPPEIVPVTTAGTVSTAVIASRASPTSTDSALASLWTSETSSVLNSTTSSVYTIPTSSPAAPFANYGAVNKNPAWYVAYTGTLLWLGVWYCCG